MAIVEMKKVTLIGLQQEKPAVLKALQEMGSVEIRDISELGTDSCSDAPKGADSSDLEQKLSQVKFAIEFLSRYNKEKKGMFEGKQNITLSELSEVMEEDNQKALLKIAARCREAEETLSLLRSKRLRLVNLKEQMLPWKDLGIPLEEVADTEKTRVFAGIIAKERTEAFQDLFNNPQRDGEGSEDNFHDFIYSRHVSTHKGDSCYLVLYPKELDNIIQDKLRDLGFNRVSFSGLRGTPEDIISQYDEDIRQIDREEHEIANEMAKHLTYLNQMQILYDGLAIELEKHAATERILNTGKAYIAKGWIKKSDTNKLIEKLSGITDALQIDFEDPDPDEEIPVVLNNPKLIEPFEVVTNLYSTPSPKGIDPNAAMAPFFFAFFGIMMGDAGYGVVMAIAAVLFLKKLKPKDTLRKMCVLIALTGISTLIWGALSGSWLGDLGDTIVQRFGLKSTVLWFNPMQEPVKMLIFCFAFGLIHVFVGMGIKAYMNIREGKVWDAVFDQGFWYVLIIGLLLIVSPFASVGKVLALLGAIGLVLTQGRDKKNIFARFFSGLLSLYDITGILSDVLSYSRLFALGLASGVIGMVINLLAFMLMAKWYGWIFGVLVLVGGHVFNIAINVLGAFVHSARLQYIEFFGKFYEGGGRPFTPLTFKTKYIDLTY